MARFADYTRFAASYCPNLPAIVFSRAMLSAAREYFTRTQAWIETVSVDLVPGENSYVIPNLSSTAMVSTVSKVLLGDKFLTAVEREYTDIREGTPEYFSNPTKSTITVYPIPKEVGTLQITVNLKPSINTTELPDALFDEHFEGLIAGCIFHIKQMPGTDWHDPQSAIYFSNEFNRFIDDKRIELAMGNNNTELTIHYPSFT
jgi:hypothetical protein